MHVSVKTFTRTQTIAKTEDLGEFELTFSPVYDTYVEVKGNKAVIGYTAYDSDCENPMTSCDCMGEFIVGDSRSKNYLPHLGLESTSYRGDIFRDLECDGVHEKAVALLKERLILDQDFLDYCEEKFERVTEEDKADMAFMESCIDQIDWGPYGDVIPSWLESSWVSAQNDAWDQLYDQGKIGTYLAVPCRWHESVHGPGTSQAYPCSLEDCNAVWIPTKHDLPNLNIEGASYQTLYANAVAYAKGCLDEYIKWCNGDCYGIVVETYTREDSESDWELVESDHCWGYIGSEYAEEEVKGLFESTCNNYLKEEVQ
jgi:hypothetical protein